MTMQPLQELEGVCSIAFLIWFFYGPWNQFVLDLCRQNLFELRDDIFLSAADGKINFDSPQYMIVREKLNKMIRYCHHLTFPTFVAVHLASPSKVQAFDTLSAIRNIQDKETARKIERYYFQAILIMMAALVMRSAFLIPLVMLAPIIAVVGLLKGAQEPERIVRSISTVVEYDIEMEPV